MIYHLTIGRILKSFAADTNIDIIFDTRKPKQTMKQRSFYKNNF